MAKFSIILPVRNGGEYVKECIYSILNQTISDFDLVVLDNASTDGTPEWIASLKDDRIKIYQSTKDLTIEENWARVLTVPKNEFITLIGHDDILFENYLFVINGLIETYPDASLYHTHFRFIGPEGNLIRKCKPMDKIQKSYDLAASILTSAIDINGTGFMMRAVDYNSVLGIPTRYPNLLFADFELWLEITQKSYKVTASEECFAFRKHFSTTTLSADIKMQRAFFMFIDYLKKLKTTDNLINTTILKYSLDFVQKNCKSFAHRMLRTPAKKREGNTVLSFIYVCKKKYAELTSGTNFYPEKELSVKLAIWIDSNALTRYLFLLFKKIYSKPIMD